MFIALGILAMFHPTLRLIDLIEYLGIVLIIFAVILVLISIKVAAKNGNRGFLRFAAFVQGVVGGLILTYPKYSEEIYTTLVGIWAVLIGFSQFIVVTGDRRRMILFIINGVISISLGILILLNPFKSEGMTRQIVGLFSLILGGFILYIAVLGLIRKRSQLEAEAEKRQKEAKASADL